LVLHTKRARIVGPSEFSSTPAWANPVVVVALEHTEEP
jgi:hypothetical protein